MTRVSPGTFAKPGLPPRTASLSFSEIGIGQSSQFRHLASFLFCLSGQQQTCKARVLIYAGELSAPPEPEERICGVDTEPARRRQLGCLTHRRRRPPPLLRPVRPRLEAAAFPCYRATRVAGGGHCTVLRPVVLQEHRYVLLPPCEPARVGTAAAFVGRYAFTRNSQRL